MVARASAVIDAYVRFLGTPDRVAALRELKGSQAASVFYDENVGVC